MAQYGKPSYWDDRYTKDPEPFDWYQRYSGIKDILSTYVKKEDQILMSGAGNSRLSEDMAEDGYKSLYNIDISQVVVQQMVAKMGDRMGFEWKQMDATSLDFSDESFDAVVDKALMDSLLCGEGSTANVNKMCAEVSRVLKPKGVYIVISYGIPDNRLSYLERKDYNWSVTVKTVPKPTVSATAVPDTKDASSVHYIYIMQKGAAAAKE
mmetsp:Transcript_46548/g.68795  ORF Transcript_46548/g.68795 Transcript_46548/m.68795 type:complete len:209 (+) Transcript_46548:94-720(+)|eukprot:CAMPEP_0195525372 /NCGR_PEP_ID=MMETSP0794_2-20130614/25801_1 /TAXON_ID=515487 /ORGANISM="Stephanopyxis turris, Strain CCMP 815" /LENGTH=208 /DNA_ID=CAMNT_0040655827 /DNA_START=94 /DNA_END=720 /DNA_ORIENTATION=-